jgi:RimJ/RimL family protein N-acetyltransferase
MRRFQTARLSLREWQETDAAHAYAIYSDPEVMRWLGGSVVVQCVEDQAASIRERALQRQESGTPFGGWAIVLNGIPIGTALLKPLPPEEVDIEIGWHIAQSHWGQGYAPEAIRALIEYAFNELQIGRLHAVLWPDNVKSRRVCEKLGMVEQPHTDRYYGHTLAHYTLDRQSWT